nr:hypothetical protein [Clostridia bacterium]
MSFIQIPRSFWIGALGKPSDGWAYMDSPGKVLLTETEKGAFVRSREKDIVYRFYRVPISRKMRL